MADAALHFPVPGCIVECMHGNRPTPFWVLEARDDSVRLLSLTRRESKLSISRLLPWLGPLYSGEHSRQEMTDILESRRAAREQIAVSLDMQELWELAQGEVANVSPRWLAELVWAGPDEDQVAGMGQAALAAKSYFKFAPPFFEIYTAAQTARRLEERAAQAKREELASAGAAFFAALWEIANHRRPALQETEQPAPVLAEQLKTVLLRRLADPEADDQDGLWRLLAKGLPDDVHMPLYLAEAWGIVPRHYNFWMDRAGYNPSPDWATPYASDMDALRQDFARRQREAGDAPEELTLVSIDAATTRDIDDAVCVTRDADGAFHAILSFSCPALCWPFGSALDKEVARRGSSIYLPEGDCHMLPAEAGIRLFSLTAGQLRPSMLLDIQLDARGVAVSIQPRVGWVRVAANLTFEAVQTLLAPLPGVKHSEEELARAAPYAALLTDAHALARLLRARRLEAGAIITDRPDPKLLVCDDGRGDVTVQLECPPVCTDSQLLVSELMIAANSLLAAWALEQGVPLFFRTQDVALPKEFSGVWTKPEDIARVVRHMPQAGMEARPHPHAGLGASVYAPLTSPLRRYADLINEMQIVRHLCGDAPRLTQGELESLLPQVSARLDQAAQIQRFRPRYWKLLYFRQMGDKVWWDGVVTEESDLYVTVSLPFAQIFIRTRRRLLDEKMYPGQALKVRIGKVHPLANEIQILETAIP